MVKTRAQSSRKEAKNNVCPPRDDQKAIFPGEYELNSKDFLSQLAIPWTSRKIDEKKECILKPGVALKDPLAFRHHAISQNCHMITESMRRLVTKTNLCVERQLPVTPPNPMKKMRVWREEAYKGNSVYIQGLSAKESNLVEAIVKAMGCKQIASEAPIKI